MTQKCHNIDDLVSNLRCHGKGEQKCVYIGFTEVVLEKLRKEYKIESQDNYILIHPNITFDSDNYIKWIDINMKEIKNNINNDLISLVVYEPTHFINFKPTNEFERWATVEVTNYNSVPSEMEIFDLQGGLYAVFDYKGLNTDNSIFQYILGTWLPNSEYKLDNRPHFEVLGEKYKNNDPNSEEEIWIPIKKK